MTGRTQSARAHNRHLCVLRSGTAMAAALVFCGLGLAAPAHAQGFNGTVTSQIGATVNAANTDVTIFGSEAIINWNATGTTAADTNVDFLPVGSSVLFHDVTGSSSGSFTVLNRIMPTYTDIATGTTTNLAATISLSGTVNSSVSNVQGGNVWFYSPYGIITNGTSAFNVGGLLLTTSDIDTSNGGSLYLASPAGSQKIGFLPAVQANSFVRLLPGTQINAAGDPTVINSAYVGVFAPRIEQGGTIASDGMTALVAGEAGTITFNLGLIDVAVTTGTTDSNGIVHSGSTGGPASTGETQTIALVAIPQNAALTMLLSGSIGYIPAAAAVPDGSAVVLNAGFDPALPTATLAAGYGNIAIDNTVFSNTLTASATGAIDVSSTAIGLTDFQQNTSLYAGQSITLTANAGQEIRARDSLFLGPRLPFQAPDITLTVTGATVAIPVDGKIDVTNQLTIDASNTPDFAAPVPLNGRAATGGTLMIAVSKGTLSAGGGLYLFSNGTAESGIATGGTGTGGTIDIAVTNKGAITTPSLFVQAVGSGGSGVSSVSVPGGGIGGDGIGGTITLSDGDTTNGFGKLNIGSVDLVAEGSGTSGAATSGSGFGGKIAITIGEVESWTRLNASASAYNGGLLSGTTVLGNVTGQVGGLTLTVSGVGGSLALGSATLDNSAYTNIGSTVAHSVQAGGVAVTADTGGTLSITGTLTVTANATLPIDRGVPPVTAAPSMTGGTVSILANGGTITADTVTATASATAVGASQIGALGRGGSATLGAVDGGLVSLLGTGTSTISADAYGAVGPVAGNATGGAALVFASDGTITAPNGAPLLVSASAISGGIGFNSSGSPGNGYQASGGSANVEVRAGALGTGSITLDTLDVRAAGNATVQLSPSSLTDPATFTSADIIAIQGDGGIGRGGFARVTVQAGTLTANTLTVRANGIGGTADFAAPATPAWLSGVGLGGTATITQTGGAVNVGNLDVAANAHGGGYVATGNIGFVLPGAGNGFAGTARISLAAGTMTITGGLQIAAAAIGGDGSSTLDPTLNGGTGAGALGGLAELLMIAGSTATFTAPTVTVSASAVSGNGGISSGGGIDGTSSTASAGTARFNLADGAFTVTGAARALADATAGSGSTTGQAGGGTAAFLLTDTVAAPATTRSLGSLLLSATPSSATGVTGAGTTQLTVKAGTAAAALAIAGNFTATAPGAAAFALPGDGFTADLGAIPVSIGGNALINVARDVTMTLATGGGLNIGGTLTINGRTVLSSGTGVLSATGNAAVNATTAIDLAALTSGGTTSLQGNSGAVVVADLSSVGAVTASGTAITLGSASAQPLLLTSATATAGAIAVTTAANLTVGTASATGTVGLTSTGGTVRNTGAVSGSAITLGAGADILIDGVLTTPGALSATATGAVTASVPVSVGGNVSIVGGTGITFGTLGSGGTTLLQATNGAVTVSSLTSPGLVTLSGRSASVTSPGALSFTSATTTAGALSVQTAGNLAVTAASANGSLTLVSTGGSLGVGTASATGNLGLSAGGGDLALTAGSAGGTASLNAPLGAITATLSSTGPVDAQARAVTINSPGSLQFNLANASAGAFIVTAAGAIRFASVDAAGSLTATSGGLFGLSGTADAGTITVTSADIQLGAAAQLGTRGRTTSIALINGSSAGTFIGGPAQAGGWRLDAAEAARLFADQSIQIGVSAPAGGAGPADVVIGTLSLSYGPAVAGGPSPNLGNGGTFAVGTSGRIAVTGPVTLASSASNDQFTLAGGTIDVVGPNGSIAMLDANGGLSGTLRLSAATVRAGSAAALADISGGAPIYAINARLGLNDGIQKPEGYLRANAIAVDVGTGFFVQNTGATTLPGDRRGFTTNSLFISTQSSAAGIAINGVIVDPKGGLITGLDTQHSIFVNDAAAASGGAFDPMSTVNGCVIGGDCTTITPVVIIPSGPIIEVLLIPPGLNTDAQLNLPIIAFDAPPLLDSPPLIDEPVTGIGNDDLWQQQCSADTDCDG